MQSANLLRLGLLASLLGGSGSCGSGDSNVVVSVSGLPQRATKLTLKASLDGRAATSGVDLVAPGMPLDRFGFAMPSDSAGHLTLDATAYDSDGCAQGVGQGQVDLPVARADIQLPMAAQSPRKCGSLTPCSAGSFCAENPKPQPDTIWAMWATSASDIWAVGDNGSILHYNGTAWQPFQSGTTSYLNAVWASGPADVWAVGMTSTIVHYDGKKWSSVANGATYDFNGVFGKSATDVWAVGSSPSATVPGEFWHWDGGSWKTMNNTIGGKLYGVWASSPSNIIACGVGGLLIQFNGSSFSTIASNTFNDLRFVWGLNASQVFVAGNIGTLLHYDGASWQKLTMTGSTSNLYAITGDDSTVYVVGNNGNFLRATTPFTSFTAFSSGSSVDTYAMALGDNGIGWVGGYKGFLAHFDTRP